ncbi:MAG: PKD domain-containing protein [Nocardioidaceae bacterium]
MGTLLVGVPGTSVAADTGLYVDKTVAACSDTGPGTADTPYCTIVKGVSQLQAGRTLFIGDGTYAETVKPLVSGTAAAPVSVTSWPGRSPVIGTGLVNGALVSSRSYVVLSGLTFSETVADGVNVSSSNHVTVSGNTVRGAGEPRQGETAPGISVRSTSSSTVTGNTVDHNSDHGIYVTGSTSTGNLVADNAASFNAEGWRRNANGIDVLGPGNTVLRNVVHDNEDSGLQFFTGGNNNLAALNVSYRNGDHGIDDYGVTGGRLIGNTVYRNCTSGINVEGTSGSYLVANNIAVDNAVYPAYNDVSCARRAGNIGIWDSAPASTTVDHNLVWLSKTTFTNASGQEKPAPMYTYGSGYTTLAAMQAATHQEANGVQADPRFTSAATGDLRLSAGSPAEDRADSGVAGEQDTDLLGNARVRDPSVDNSHASGPRPYDDLGAYELQPPVLQRPTAGLTATPATGTAPLQVNADASTSTDPQGQTLTYAFDYGDGTTSGTQTSPTTTHGYTTAGTYQLSVTVRDTSGLTDTATRTITVTTAPPPPSAPTARLTATPATGTAPLQVNADASTSTDPQGQTLTYAFDYGDGTTSGTQTSPTTTHGYTTAGTYQLSVTVRDTSGLTDTTSRTITVTTAPPPAPAAYVGSVATNYSTSTKTAGYVTVWRSAGVRAGDLVLLTVELGGTAPTGRVSATDAAGNTYTTAADVADGSGNRLLMLSGVASTALAVNDRITVTFPTATSYRIFGDELSGVHRVDQASTALGAASTYASGVAQATTGNEVAAGAVLLPAGPGAPTWASGWKDLGPAAVGSAQLGRAYRLAGVGSYTATGTAAGPWLAAVVTLAP